MALLIPSFITLDGVRFPLYAHPTHVGLANTIEEMGALCFALAEIVNGGASSMSLDELSRDGFHIQELSLLPVDVEHRLSLQGDGPLNWKRLSGRWPDFRDSFLADAGFVRQALTVPRPVVLELVTILRALRADVLAGRREGRVDDTPLPPRPPRTPEQEEYARLMDISIEDGRAYLEDLYARRP